jgi:imidazolonepropionase-like amidohydrolase
MIATSGVGLTPSCEPKSSCQREEPMNRQKLRTARYALLSLGLLVPSSSVTGCADSSDEVSATEEEIRAESGDLVIRNAQLLDPATRTVKRGALLVHDGRIKQVATRGGALRIVGQPKELDAKGGYVMPGLADMHTHLFFGDASPHGFDEASSQDHATQEQLGKRYLYSGVTTYLDLFAPNDAGDNPAGTLGADLNIFSVRQKAREDKPTFVHPNSFVAGPLFVVPGSHGVVNWGKGDVVRIDIRDAAGALISGQAMSALEDTVAKRVEKLIDDRHPDVIKFIYNNHEDEPEVRPESMPLSIAKAIINAAKRKGTKTVAHVGTWQAVEDLANAGLSAFTHLPTGAAPASTIRAIKDHNTTAITTMSIYNDYGDMAVDAKRTSYFDMTAHPLLFSVIPAGLAVAYRDFAGYTAVDKGWVAWGEKHNRLDSQGLALRSLIAGGVQILPGSDSGNTGAFYGYSLSRELINFERAGMPRWEILRAATLESQKFLGQTRGGLAVGQNADLIVLTDNPLDSLANLQKISGVVLRGKVLDRSTLLQ